MNEKYIKAAAILAERVYNPVFFEKLASYGIVPETEAEAVQLLQLALEVKTAAVSLLNEVEPEVPDKEVKEAAQQFVNDDLQTKTAAFLLS